MMKSKPLHLRRTGIVASLAALGWIAGAVLPTAAVGATYDKNGPIHQLRIYEIFEGNKAAFHARFRDHALPIMRRHGFDIASIWEAKGPERTEFVYVVRWPNESIMRERWANFMADAEWATIKNETGAVHGRLVGTIQERILQQTDYSPGSWR